MRRLQGQAPRKTLYYKIVGEYQLLQFIKSVHLQQNDIVIAAKLLLIDR
jgi:hypothetical protein